MTKCSIKWEDQSGSIELKVNDDPIPHVTLVLPDMKELHIPDWVIKAVAGAIDG